MKHVKYGLVLVLMLSTVLTTYPQSMLISHMCSNEEVNVQVVDKVYKSKNKYLDINITIPQINSLNNKDEQKKINDEIVKNTEAWINDVQKIADEYFKDGTAPLYPYQLYSRYILTNVDGILSLYIDNYQYTGGAHGITTRVAYTVDKSSGKVLRLTDLFKEGYNYKNIIDTEIVNEISKNPDRYFTGKEGFNGICDDTKYYIKDNYLVIYFGQYEIAPYAAGMPEFLIPINIFHGNYIYGKV